MLAVIKSPFTFEFLGIKSKELVLETDLEQAIMEVRKNE
jgi:predicted nuclease of restriction endonuclease-like (RecB) superfamily